MTCRSVTFANKQWHKCNQQTCYLKIIVSSSKNYKIRSYFQYYTKTLKTTPQISVKKHDPQFLAPYLWHSTINSAVISCSAKGTVVRNNTDGNYNWIECHDEIIIQLRIHLFFSSFLSAKIDHSYNLCAHTGMHKHYHRARLLLFTIVSATRRHLIFNVSKLFSFPDHLLPVFGFSSAHCVMCIVVV